MIEAILNVASPAAAAGSSFHLSCDGPAGVDDGHLAVAEELACRPRHAGDHRDGERAGDGKAYCELAEIAPRSPVGVLSNHSPVWGL
jgi:hypothetical protein